MIFAHDLLKAILHPTNRRECASLINSHTAWSHEATHQDRTLHMRMNGFLSWAKTGKITASMSNSNDMRLKSASLGGPKPVGLSVEYIHAAHVDARLQQNWGATPV